MSDFDNMNESGTDFGTETRARPKRPPLYKVLMLNDDYTPMDFVIAALELCFGKSHDEAAEITLQIHRRGIGVCGVFTYDIAETKMMQVLDLAREHQHPLQCMIERA